MAESATLADVWGVYRKIVAGRIRAQWQYRISFFAEMLTSVAFTMLDLIAILALFQTVESLAGWSVVEVAFLYGLTGVGMAIADIAVGSVERVSDRIRNGTFDLLLVRPLGTLVQVVAEDFKFRRVGRLLQTSVVFLVAVVASDVDWTIDRVLLLPAAIISSGLLYGALFVSTACLSFWFINGREAANALTYGGNYLTSYPIHLFAEWVRHAVFFAVPLAFVAYVPAIRLLDAPNPLGVPLAAQFLSPLIACAAALVAGRTWTFAIGHYRSTGS